MTRGKKIYFGILLLIIFFISTAYFSYSFFTSKNEEHGKLNIIAGTLDYKIESGDLKNNQMVIEPTTTKQIVLKITSLNDITSKYELYYTIDNGLNVEVGYNMNTKDFISGEIDVHGTKKVTLLISNNTTVNQTVTFGVEGGLLNQFLTLTEGNSIEELNLYASDLSYGGDYTECTDIDCALNELYGLLNDGE